MMSIENDSPHSRDCHPTEVTPETTLPDKRASGFLSIYRGHRRQQKVQKEQGI